MISLIPVKCCIQNNHDYIVTYSKGMHKTGHICVECWNKKSEMPWDLQTKKVVHLLQIFTSKIICKNCNMDVTSTMGCNSCHPVTKDSFDDHKEDEELKNKIRICKEQHYATKEKVTEHEY